MKKMKQEEREKKLVWELIAHGELTLPKLAELTHISLPLVTKIMESLAEKKLVKEIDYPDILTVGRPAVRYKLHKAIGYMLAIDLGRVYTNYLIIDTHKNVICEEHKNSIPLNDKVNSLQLIENNTNNFLSKHNISWDEVFCVGVSIPGLVNGSQGKSETYLNFDDEPIAKKLSKIFNKPVRIEHDVKSMTIGELCYGKAKGTVNTICINYGWGLGAGLVLNSQIYKGSDGFAGEFGHIPLNQNDELCYCGKTGCLETLSSGRAIIKKAQKLIDDGAETILRKKAIKIEKVSINEILDAANLGDQFCIELLEDAGRYLGQGIAILINLFNPEKIIIGGDMVNIADYLLNLSKSGAMKHSLVRLNKNVKFEISELANNAPALGVAMLSLREFIK